MPTALELTREEWKRYRPAADLGLERFEMTAAQREIYDRIMARVRAAAVKLKEDFGVRRVILFGSLAHSAWFRADTDVDMAVEGLDTAEYWEAWRFVEELIADRPVDFIELESASDALRRSIEQFGVDL